MCERGLQVPASARAQSELWEFLAISLAQLGYPEPVVRRLSRIQYASILPTTAHAGIWKSLKRP